MLANGTGNSIFINGIKDEHAYLDILTNNLNNRKYLKTLSGIYLNNVNYSKHNDIDSEKTQNYQEEISER